MSLRRGTLSGLVTLLMGSEQERHALSRKRPPALHRQHAQHFLVNYDNTGNIPRDGRAALL
jgi:hypothetical protein